MAIVRSWHEAAPAWRILTPVRDIGVSHRERLGLIRRIRRTPGLLFMPPEWLPRRVIDATYFNLLPSGERTVTREEADILKVIFGEEGELPAQPAS